MRDDHLSTIDSETWPGIATVPSGLLGGVRARRAEAEFAKACARAAIRLDSDDEHQAEMTVLHDALFSRIAASGWLGFAESYMAGEWTTPDSDGLVKVLSKLINAGYNPRASAVAPTNSSGGELPQELIRLFSGDSMSLHGGIYSSGVATTVRTEVPSFDNNKAGRSPKTHFVDKTEVSDPSSVDRKDLKDAQIRAADWLLDATLTGAGSHVLIYSATGAQPAIRATARRATVDILTADDNHASDLEDELVLAGAAESVHCHVTQEPVVGPREWRGRYDCVISMEQLETLAPSQRKAYFSSVSRLLAHGGKLGMQAVIADEKATPAAHSATSVLRAYIWPGLEYPTMTELHRVIDKSSGLRIIAQTHFRSHYVESLAQQRSYFEGHVREAAAAGFDQVFRRLWVYQFALREALLRTGQTDAVQITATHRHRGGRR